MNIINHLPTSDVCEIVQRLRPRLFINFFHHLPPEVCLKILAYLDPVSLLNTARASREWMHLAWDRQLWENLYYQEGFRINRAEVAKFEASLSQDRTRSGSHLRDQHTSKRRAIPSRTLPALQTELDEMMMDVQTSLVPLPVDHIMSDEAEAFPDVRESTSHTHRIPPSATSLVLVDRSSGRKRLNWQHLYSLRRRLEANWEAENYTTFQLPHPDYPGDAHTECIYTIQHAGKYLVSGSRDHTLRVWDLDTRRLMQKPLRAHTGSVLCLQFDADPDEDLIVSGSSDANVVVWRFSTGQVVQKLKRAHRESVLNVRFDKRVLVTCSKDKTIKVFNRRPMALDARGQPVMVPAASLANMGFDVSPTAGLTLKPAFTMIGCLIGHGAAVNAVQIHGDEIVSASGDRTVKVWNWPRNACTRTLMGHNKGIACVQYDGRRIVSGSSDNEVKVFDKNTGVEVASLRAHTNLVRTVQAGFGDLPDSVEADAEEVRRVEHEYYQAVVAGQVSHDARQPGRATNAGSRRPEAITALGATLPPGGGGGRFGRIVSGSYDETIIIWKRDKDGAWRARHTLRQDSTVGEGRVGITAPLTPAPTPSSAAFPAPFAPGTREYYHQIIEQAVPAGAAALRQALVRYPDMIFYAYLKELIDVMDDAGQQQEVKNVYLAAINERNPVPLPSPNPLPNQTMVHSVMHAAQAQLAFQANLIPSGMSSSPDGQASVGSMTTTTTTTSTSTTAAAMAATVAPPVTPTLPAASMARVFKLQFDARRIICCSQTPIIVGWDFANGDGQIIEASRLFAPIE